jgi:hypothetical protein
VGVVAAVVAFLLGLRFGVRGSRIALCTCAVLAVSLAIWSRYEWVETHRASGAVMLAGAASLTLLSGCLAFVGPAIFRTWRFALLLSGILVAGLHWIPVNATMCVVLGVCR